MGENAVSTFILMVVEIAATVLILALVVGLIGTGQRSVDKLNTESNNQYILESNLQFEKYNGTELTYSDMYTAALVYGSDPNVTVYHGGNRIDNSSYHSIEDFSDYNPDKLTQKVTTELSYDTNGLVNKITFTG